MSSHAATPSPAQQTATTGSTSTSALTAAELQHAISHELSAEWYLKDCKLQRDWTVAASTDSDGKPLSPFTAATRFIEQFGRLAEEQSLRQPDVLLSHSQHVNVAIYTQDGDLTLITRRDIHLAKAIDALPAPPLSTEHRTRQQIREQQQAAPKEQWWDKILIEFPQHILTPRLMLRPYKASGDGPVFHELIKGSLAEFQPHLHWMTPELTTEQVEARTRHYHADWVARSGISLMILDRKTGQMLGGTSFNRVTWDAPSVCGNIGYFMDTKHVGKGYVAEAANATARFIYKYFSSCPKPLRVEIRNWEEHRASRKVAERLGFDLEKIEALGKMFPVPVPICVYVIAGVDRLPPLDVEFVHS